MVNKVKVVIASNSECNVDKAVSVPYSCQYEYAGKVRMIDIFGTYREVRGNELGRTDDNGNKTGHWPVVIDWSKTRMFHEYIYEDDENASDFTEGDKNTKLIVEKFWKGNPLALVNGVPGSNTKSNKHFDVVDSNVKTINALHSFKDKLKAANKISEMTHAERVDVAFYYGLGPVGKNEDELLVELADMEIGYCLQPTQLGEFLKIWVDGKSSDRDLLVTLKKAITLEVIKNKPTDGRAAYYLGDTFLGSDDVGLIDWTRKNPRDFEEHILRKIKEQDSKEEKVIKPVPTALGQEKVDLAAYNALKRQALELISEGFINAAPDTQKMTYVNLKRVVAEGINKKNNVTA